MLHNHVKQSDKYTATVLSSDRNKLLLDSFEELSAYLVLQGCDKSNYRSLEKGFVNQFSLKNDQYPKTVQDMTDALSKHAFDDEYYKRNKKRAEQKKIDRERNRNEKDDEEEEEQEGVSFAPVSYTHLTLPTIYSV